MLFGLYLFILLRLTVFRAGAFSHGVFSGRFNLTPGVAYMQLLSWGSTFHAAYLFFGNIVWFVPLGMYARRQGLRFISSVLCGAGLSLFIECMQFILGCGVTETDDLLLNTLGAVAGAALWDILKRLSAHKKSRRKKGG